MTETEWQEACIAGMLFAALTRDFTDEKASDALNGVESLAIDHGKLRLEMQDGRKFEIAVRLMAE